MFWITFLADPLIGRIVGPEAIFHPRTRPDLIRMVPASLPATAMLVSAAGVLELLGAIGLMVPRALPAAAYG